MIALVALLIAGTGLAVWAAHHTLASSDRVYLAAQLSVLLLSLGALGLGRAGGFSALGAAGVACGLGVVLLGLRRAPFRKGMAGRELGSRKERKLPGEGLAEAAVGPSPAAHPDERDLRRQAGRNVQSENDLDSRKEPNLSEAARVPGEPAVEDLRQAPSGNTLDGNGLGSRKEHKYLAFALLACGLLYAAMPAHHVLGGRDQGIYLICAVRLARAGGLDVDLPMLEQVPESVVSFLDDPTIGPFLGIHPLRGVVPDALRARQVPQFMHLFPALAGVGMELFGLAGLVRTNALVAVLALWSIARLGRRLVGWRGGVAVALAMGVCPATVHWARSTMSEPLALMIGMLALELWMLAWEEEDVGLGLCAGLVGGLGVLCRLDALLWVLGIGGMVLGAACAGRGRLAWGVTAGWIVGILVGLADGYLHSRPYLMGQWADTTSSWSDRGFVWIVLLQGGLPLVGFAASIGPLRRWLGRGGLASGMRVGALLVGVWVLVALAVRPWLEPGELPGGLRWLGRDEFTLRAAWELSWYVSPLMLPLAAVGLWVLSRRPDALAWAGLSAAAGGALIVLTFRPSIYADHPWCSRRWLPIAFPLGLLMAGLAIDWLRRRPRLGRLPWVLGAVYLVWVAGFGASWLRAPLMRELPDRLESLAARLRAEAREERPYLCTHDGLAASLTYVYEVPTLRLAPEQLARLRDGTFDGWRLIGLDASRPELGRPELIGDEEGRVRYTGLIGWPKKAPWLHRAGLSLATGTVRAAPGASRGEGLVIELPAGHATLHSPVGRIEGNSVVAAGEKGILIGGPHRWLPPGRYVLEWFGEVDASRARRKELVRFSLVGQRPGGGRDFRVSLMREQLPGPGQPLARLEAQLAEPMNKVEFAVRLRERRLTLRLTRVRLTRVGDAGR